MSEIPHSDFVQAEHRYRTYGPSDQPGDGWDDTDVSGWLGWLVFAAVMMALMGGLYIVAGMVTLFQSAYYEVNTKVLAVDTSWTVLGVTQIVLGALVVGAGLALLRGYAWARVVAVGLAGLTIIENFVEMAASPIWNILLIALATVTIYAIVVHGREAATD
jgi:hypothetical protein